MNEDPPLDSRYDIIIVGGRPAGARLAARLGQAGRKVLVVDKATFPSQPLVPSCPLLYPQAMALLSEMGLDESAYAAGSIVIRQVTFEFGSYFEAPIKMISSRGRDYVLGIDRARFDHVLWKALERYPSVTARTPFTVTDLVREGEREGDRVVGIVGHAPEGASQRILADWVVGADGRFSPVARKVGAKVVEDRPEHQSTVFFADWEGVAPHRGETEPLVFIHTTGRGTDVLFFPLPDGRTTVCTHQRADRVQTEGDPEAYYLREIHAYPSVKRRLESARRVTPVIGMKHVANRYLEPSGQGWVLVGDALHHKDPVDGQGIYDALLEADLLSAALVSVYAKERTPEAALAWYSQRVQEETHPMFIATLERLKTELYSEPPVVVIKTLIRWMMQDAEYQENFLRYLCREIPPVGWLSGGLMGRAAMRGAMRDLAGMFRR